MIVKKKDVSNIIYLAFLYALGRRTYIVRTTKDFIIHHLDYVSIKLRKQMIDEINNAKILGDSCDINDWLELKDILLSNKNIKSKINIENDEDYTLMINSAIRRCLQMDDFPPFLYPFILNNIFTFDDHCIGVGERDLRDSRIFRFEEYKSEDKKKIEGLFHNELNRRGLEPWR